jgi:hypothetical protein
LLDDGIDVSHVDWSALARVIIRDGQSHAERRQRSQDEPDLGARLATLDLDQPLPAHAGAVGKAALIELLTAPPIADQRADVPWGSEDHVGGRSPLSMSTSDDILACHCR